jgi:hypothetical protein
MKHLIKKISFKGAGKSPQVQQIQEVPPAVLYPPKLGLYNAFSTYSHAEIVDLLCDGPIDGLVNQDGELLQGQSILQGVYLDDAPVIVTANVDYNNSDKIYNKYDNTLSTVRTILDEVFAGTETFLAPEYTRYSQTKNYRGDLTAAKMKGVLGGAIWHYVTISRAQYGNMLWNGTRIYVTPLVNGTRTDGGQTPNFNEKRTELEYDYPGLRNWTKTNTSYFQRTMNGHSVEMHVYFTSFDNSVILNTVKNNFNNLLGTAISDYEKQYITNAQSVLKNITTGFNVSIRRSVTYDYWKNYQQDLNMKPQIYMIIDRDDYNVPGGSSQIIINFGTRSSPTNIGLSPGGNDSIFDINGNFTIQQNFYFDGLTSTNIIFNGLVPIIENNKYTGKVYGFLCIRLPVNSMNKNGNWNTVIDTAFEWSGGWNYNLAYAQVSESFYDEMKKVTSFSFSRSVVQSTTEKFNFNNVLCEYKEGLENQTPLQYFDKIYLEQDYGYRLVGPFRTSGNVRRFQEQHFLSRPDLYSKTKTTPNVVGGNPTITTMAGGEGSLDNARSGGNGQSYAAAMTYNEELSSFTHVIENTEVTHVIPTIEIINLSDTLTQEFDIDGSAGWKGAVATTLTNPEPVTSYTTRSKSAKPGTKIPAILTLEIQVGHIKNEIKTPTETRTYNIYGLIESSVLIDFGSYDNTNAALFDFISPNDNLNLPLLLPTLTSSEINSQVKRYIKVSKVSTETSSVLLRRECRVFKIIEVLSGRYSYPFSAIVGTKIDARSFSSIPSRSFDCRLKKVKVPNNYNVIDEQTGKDKRYLSSGSATRKRVYDGDWDGTFHSQLRWTDNPAWILYDILTNKRYGLGQYINESDINIWELYKIGRYCDAVDDDGYFVGVSDGRGGLEPRFSCNILWTSPKKIFDVINIIANLFRGSVFFANSEVHFVDDRPRLPTALFTNSNVKDGVFNYTNNQKNESFNRIEVSYLDKFDNFKTKIEIVQDDEDIRYRGVYQTIINTIGVTSKAMAKRIGQHMIYQTIKEDQGVEFSAGLEALLCRPGDLMIVDDEMKSLHVNYGRILEIDYINKALTLSNPYDENYFDGSITLYTPTGYLTNEELDFKAKNAGRSRVSQFTISGSKFNSKVTGVYNFSGYLGFTKENNDYIEDSVYTGTNQRIAFYSQFNSGWIFATGQAFTTSNIYNFNISEIMPNQNDEVGIEEIKSIFTYNTASENARSQTAVSIIDSLTIRNNENPTRGILDNEITTYGVRQIANFNIKSGITNINDGSIIYLGEENANLFNLVQVGSAYRCKIKDSNEQVYKIISIKENNQNEYTIVGTKYDSGKWLEIEKDTLIERPEISFSPKFSRVNSSRPPYNLSLSIYKTDQDKFSLTGSCTVDSKKCDVILENKNVGYYASFNEVGNYTNKGFLFENLSDLGLWEMSVKAISASLNEFDSPYTEISHFVAFNKTDGSEYDRPFIENFTII